MAFRRGPRPERGAAAKRRRPFSAGRLAGQRAGAWAVLAVLSSAVLGAGWWGITAERASHEDGLAAVGEAVAIPGGLVRVDRAVYEGSTSLPMSGPGMSMPMSSAPGTALPEPRQGFRRLDVDVTLLAQTSPGLPFRLESFLVGVAGRKGVVPIGVGPGSSLLPGGTALSRKLAYDVPSTARNLVLTVAGAEKPIALALDLAPQGGAHGD